MPGTLFGKQTTTSITKNDKNTRTTGHLTPNEVTYRAGVSPTAASHVLRGVAGVAEELAQEVRDAARELGYAANPATRALASTQNHSVTVLVPSLTNLLSIETLETIHAVLRPRGLEVLIDNFHYSRSEEGDPIRNYLAYQPRGLLLTDFEHTESARRVTEASGIPCVYMMGLDSDAGLNYVGFSQLRADETTAEHLPTRGHGHPAYIGAQFGQHTLLRGEGFRRALQRVGCYDPGLEILTPRPSSITLGDELFVQLLASQPQINGVSFCNDDLAQGALLEALHRGVKVPKQIAMLGFNDLPSLDCTVPRLSSIHTPREAIGRRTAEWLLALIAGKEVRSSALDMGFELVVWEST